MFLYSSKMISAQRFKRRLDRRFDQAAYTKARDRRLTTTNGGLLVGAPKEQPRERCPWKALEKAK